MTDLVWWLIAVPGVLAVLAIGATVGGTRRRRARAYSRRSARHVLGAVVEYDYTPRGYGSMILAEERAIGYGYVPAPWREQTRADLAPEALADFGPDVPFLGSVPGPERLCGPEQPHEKPAGTESAGSGHSDLGPRAALVLDRWERGFRTRWGCPWLELGALT